MNPLSALLVIAAILAIVVPLIASITICVPKWWRALFPEPAHSELIQQPRAKSAPRWYGAPWRWGKAATTFLFGIFIAFPLFVTIGAAIFYCNAWMSLIERKCPYTPRGSIGSYGSWTSKAERFKKDWHDSLKGVWTITRGSDV